VLTRLGDLDEKRPLRVRRRTATSPCALGPEVPVVVVTPRRPPARSEGDQALSALVSDVIHDVIELDSPADLARLAAWASGAPPA